MTTKRTGQEKPEQPPKVVDVIEARENVANLVRGAATAMAAGVMNGGKPGQLAAVKYLFEVAGLYPATEDTEARPAEDSLAHAILRRMGIPTEPGSPEGRRMATLRTSETKEGARKVGSAAAEDVEKKVPECASKAV